MSDRASLGMLIELARRDLEGAGRGLQRAMDARRGAQQQLELLLEYRMDYVQRLQRGSEVGMPAPNYQNFNRFIDTLDQAIAQQNNVLARLESQAAQEREQWRHQKLRLNSFEALDTRRQAQDRREQSRAEQRGSDEHSAVRHRRRQQQDYSSMPS